MESKEKKKKSANRFVLKKWAIFTLLLASFGYLASQKILKYKEKGNNLAEKETRYLIQPKIVQLAICVDIDEYTNRWYKDKTMLEIERATDGGLDDSLKDIYTNYQGKSFQSNYQVQPKKLFKQMSYVGYRRCFPLSIHSSYQIAPSNPKLTIKFKKKERYEVYLLSEEEDLNSKSFWYSGWSVFVERIVKRLKTGGRCVDYKEKNAGNCTEPPFGYYDDLDYNPDYQPVIDRDWFSSTEWNTSKLVRDDEIYRDILKNCTGRFQMRNHAMKSNLKKLSEANNQIPKQWRSVCNSMLSGQSKKRPPPGIN